MLDSGSPRKIGPLGHDQVRAAHLGTCRHAVDRDDDGVGQVGRLGLERDGLRVDHVDGAGLGLADHVHGDLDGDLLALADREQVDVLDDLPHRVPLDVLGDGQRLGALDVEGEQGVGVLEREHRLVTRQRDVLGSRRRGRTARPGSGRRGAAGARRPCRTRCGRWRGAWCRTRRGPFGVAGVTRLAVGLGAGRRARAPGAPRRSRRSVREPRFGRLASSALPRRGNRSSLAADRRGVVRVGPPVAHHELDDDLLLAALERDGRGGHRPRPHRPGTGRTGLADLEHRAQRAAGELGELAAAPTASANAAVWPRRRGPATRCSPRAGSPPATSASMASPASARSRSRASTTMVTVVRQPGHAAAPSVTSSPRSVQLDVLVRRSVRATPRERRRRCRDALAPRGGRGRLRPVTCAARRTTTSVTPTGSGIRPPRRTARSPTRRRRPRGRPGRSAARWTAR